MESDAGHLPISHKAWAWFEANKKPALFGGGAIIVVGVIVAFVLYQQSEAQITASEALSKAALPIITSPGRGENPEALLKVAATYPSSRAAGQAVLLAAGGLFVEGKYPEAKAQFERFRREQPDSPFVGEALLGIAACLDAQGQTGEAMSAYKALIERHPNDYMLPQARFALARLYEAQNDIEQARNLYEEVERTDLYGALGSEAGMRLEELKMKYPKLEVPPPPPLTNLVPPTVKKR